MADASSSLPALGSDVGQSPAGRDYGDRVQEEKRFFGTCHIVHDLPGIFHYWSNTYIRPKLRALGFEGSQEFFGDSLQAQCVRNTGRETRFLSIGSGNCDLEMDLVERLRRNGCSHFVFDCLDLSEDMLERARREACRLGILEHLDFIVGDFNDWKPAREYDSVVAIQSLHHVVNLERLFAGIKESLRRTGCFVVSDMIGRNGHMRWPEALPIVQEYWRKLPPSYRYNQQLQCYEESYVDRDCSQEGFEGVRAQDILPLLIETFHFQKFLAFGNVIDPFVSRGIGRNFDAGADWDRAFIDEVHQRDERELADGTIKPTHLFAVLGTEADGPTDFLEPHSPSFCLRRPGRDERLESRDERGKDQELYEWDSWPHSLQDELKTACARLAAAEGRIQELYLEIHALSAKIVGKEQEFEQRTAWALQLDAELRECTLLAARLSRDAEESTAWAHRLDLELEERTAQVLALQRELEDRTAWAIKLDLELKELRQALANAALPSLRSRLISRVRRVFKAGPSA